MDTSQPLTLLGGLSPQQFMRRYWHKRPLLVRQAVPDFEPLLSARQLCDLAASQDLESRLVVQQPLAGSGGGAWSLRKGPFKRRSLPSLRQRGWTLLVQGVDLHHAAAHEFLQQFRFVPDARLDDLMISLASEGGGVGPHFDSYDVFLFQASGSRRWRTGAQTDLRLREDLPLKILRTFKPEQDWVLHAGDMLYLPPRYAHDGVALADPSAPCMTYSIGFRAPARHELVSALLARWADELEEEGDDRPAVLYRDPGQPATESPAQLPEALVAFAEQGLRHALRDPDALRGALGCYLSEPKPGLWFEPSQARWTPGRGLRLQARTRMLYDRGHLFINGERFETRGTDARLLRRLADERRLGAREIARLSEQARAIVLQWLADGWLILDSEAI